ncbi:MAG: HAD hydrolase-like protein [Burkholderiales bacterium]|nr:HAD hydrolase-like protein [Burkholderiales bacterium]
MDRKAVRPPRAILFDFDGTLVDSAPDLAGAVNDLRAERGLPAMPFDALRPFATYGARSLLKAGLDLTPEHDDYDATRRQFLSIYDRRKLDKSHLFDGVLELLIALERRGLAWGIVTNKMSRLAEPMIHDLLRDRAFAPAVVVCGDSTTTPKPNPAPLLLAARDAQIDVNDCWFVGDGESDVRASHAAGMTAVLATYGYIPDLTAARAWGAHHEITRPLDLLGLLDGVGVVATPRW